MTTPQLPVLPDMPGDVRLTSVWEKDPEISAFTGQPLRRVELELYVRGDASHEALSTALDAAGSDGPWLSDSDGRTWKVSTHSVSYVAGQATTRYDHKLALDELEQLDLQSVELAGLALLPERWEPRRSREQQSLWLLATVTPQVHEQFETALGAADEAQDRYFPVILRGVSQEPVSMR